MKLTIHHLSNDGNQRIKTLHAKEAIIDWGYELTSGNPEPAIKLITETTEKQYVLLGIHNIETIFNVVNELIKTNAAALSLPIDIFDPSLPSHSACTWSLEDYFDWLHPHLYQRTEAFALFSSTEKRQILAKDYSPITKSRKKSLAPHWRARLPIPQKDISKLKFFNEILDNRVII
jgi:hypothetical protein